MTKNILKLFFSSAAILILGLILGNMYGKTHIDYVGYIFPSKQLLCQNFASSYLETIKKVENVNPLIDEDKWNATVAVESDLYDLCLINLDKGSLIDYKPNNIERYLNNYR